MSRKQAGGEDVAMGPNNNIVYRGEQQGSAVGIELLEECISYGTLESAGTERHRELLNYGLPSCMFDRQRLPREVLEAGSGSI